jgi:hypothetical protein
MLVVHLSDVHRTTERGESCWAPMATFKRLVTCGSFWCIVYKCVLSDVGTVVSDAPIKAAMRATMATLPLGL